MGKIYKKFISRYSLSVILVLAAIFFLLSFHNRYIEDDEAVLGEYSYYFLHEGIVRWKTMPDILNFDSRVYPHHRFFTWFGAFIIQIFGWSIDALKASTLLWYTLFFLLLYKYFQLTTLENKKQHFVIAAFIIFTAPIILLKAFSFRPDVLLMTEGLAALFFLKRYRITGVLSNAMIAGAIAGLAFLTHLNGVAFCVTGFFFLLLFKEFKALLIFTVSGAVVGGLYFIELLPPGNFDAFIYQLTNWPTVNHGENYIGGGFLSIIGDRVLKLFSEHQRFFWGDKVIAFSGLFFIALLFNFRAIKKKDKEVLYYILILIPALNIFGSHVAERYLLFYYGPMAIISAIWLYDLQFRKSIALKLLTLAVVALHLFFGVKMLIKIEERSSDSTKIHQEVLSSLEDPEAQILAPYAFIYDELERYDLYAFKTYEYLQEDIETPMSQEYFFRKASSLGMDYIIIDKEQRERRYMKWLADGEIEANDYYEVKSNNNDFLILKSIQRSTSKVLP